MEASKARLREAEARLDGRTDELAALREKCMTSEHRNFQQLKKLTQQLEDMKLQVSAGGLEI